MADSRNNPDLGRTGRRAPCLALALFAGGAAFCVSAQASSTIAWYRFNAGPNGAQVQTATDSGPNSLNGVVTGDWYYSNNRTPHGGGKYSLNATADYDYAIVGDTAALDPTGSFNLSAWAYPTGGQNPDGVGDSIANKHDTAQVGTCIVSYGIYYNATTGQFSASVCGSSNPNAASAIVYSTDTYPLNAWQLVEMKYKFNSIGRRATLSLYVNGQLEGSQILTDFDGIYFSSAPFQIGAENSGTDGDHDFYRRNFYGYIDEVKLTAAGK
jgi:hypothetical protein